MLSCKYVHYVLIILFCTLLCTSCSQSNPKEKWNSELQQLMALGDTASYSLDSVHLDIYDQQTCKLQYYLSSFTDIKTTFDSLNGNTPDSVDDEDNAAAILPLLVSESHLEFISYPTLEREKQPELIEVRSKSGGYFYLLAINQKDVYSMNYDSLGRRGIISCTILLPSADNYLYLPQNNVNRMTAYYLSTPWNRTLKEFSVNSSEKSKPIAECNEYPKDLRPFRRTFVVHTLQNNSALVGLNLEIQRFRSPVEKVLRTFLSLILILIAGSQLLTLFIDRWLPVEFTELVRWKKLMILNIVNRLNPRSIEETISNWGAFQIVRYDVLLYLQRFSQIEVQQQFAKPMWYKMWFSIFLTGNEIREKQEAQIIASMQAKLENYLSDRRVETDSPEFNWFLKSLHEDSILLQAVNSPSTVHIQHKKKAIFYRLFLCLLFILLGLAAAFAQANPKKNLIRNLEIELSPTFPKPGKMDLKAHLRLLVTTWDARQKKVSVGFRFPNTGEADPPDAKAFPGDVTAEITSGGNHADKTYRFVLTGRYKTLVSHTFFRILQAKALVDQASSTNEQEAKSETSDNFNYIDLDIPFTNYTLSDKSKNGWGIYQFPWDEREVRVLIQTEQFAELQQPIMKPITTFTGDENLQFCVVDGKNNQCLSTLELKDGKMVKNGSTLVVTAKLTRNWFARWFLPILLIVLAVLAGWLSSKPDKGIWKALAGIGSFGALSTLYKYVMDTYYPAIPNALDGLGSLTLFDCIYAFSFVLFLFVVIISHRKLEG